MASKIANQCLNNTGLQYSEIEPCVFKGEIQSDIVIVIVYVDDLLIASRNSRKLKTVKDIPLCGKFKMKDLGQVTEILGMRVEREGATGSIRISQEAYTRRIIEKFNMTNVNPTSTPMEAGMKLSREDKATEEENKDMQRLPYRELVESLIYLANTTRSDLAFTANTLSRFNKPWKNSLESNKTCLEIPNRNN